jgi:hypothetical protein
MQWFTETCLLQKPGFIHWYLCYHFSVKPSKKEVQHFTILLTFHNAVEVGLKLLEMIHS